MKTLTILTVLIISGCSSTHTPFVQVGAGYKFQEAKLLYTAGYDENSEPIKKYFNDPISARIQMGVEAGNWVYGVAHHSQWSTGWPWDNTEHEPNKSEVFLDYKYKFDSWSF